MATAKSTEATLMQPATGAKETQIHPLGEKLIEQAMTGQHWVAIGDNLEDTEGQCW